MMKQFSGTLAVLIASFGIWFLLVTPMLNNLTEVSTSLTLGLDSDCQQVYKENLINETRIGIGLFKSFKASPNLEHAEVYECAANDIDSFFTGI